MGIGIGSRLAQAIPLRLYRLVFPRRVVGFNYHLVSSAPTPHCPDPYVPKDSESFEADLISLKRNFQPISYEELSRSVNFGTKLPPGAAIVTCDDGFAECFSVMRPLLLKHSIPCIFFLTVDLLDNHSLLFQCKVALCLTHLNSLPAPQKELAREKLNLRGVKSVKALHFRDQDVIDQMCDDLGVNWREYLRTRKPFLSLEEARSLGRDGFCLGAHTLSHPDLRVLPEAIVANEVLASVDFISELSGSKEIPFAFPWSGEGISRAFLHRLRLQEPRLGLYFDTLGLTNDEPIVTQRVTADHSPRVRGESNLIELLKGSYFNHGLRKIARWTGRR